MTLFAFKGVFISPESFFPRTLHIFLQFFIFSSWDMVVPCASSGSSGWGGRGRTGHHHRPCAWRGRSCCCLYLPEIKNKNWSIQNSLRYRTQIIPPLNFEFSFPCPLDSHMKSSCFLPSTPQNSCDSGIGLTGDLPDQIGRGDGGSSRSHLWNSEGSLGRERWYRRVSVSRKGSEIEFIRRRRHDDFSLRMGKKRYLS